MIIEIHVKFAAYRTLTDIHIVKETLKEFLYNRNH